jgi:hypothetical protein
VVCAAARGAKPSGVTSATTSSTHVRRDPEFRNLHTKHTY